MSEKWYCPELDGFVNTEECAECNHAGFVCCQHVIDGEAPYTCKMCGWVANEEGVCLPPETEGIDNE